MANAQTAPGLPPSGSARSRPRTAVVDELPTLAEPSADWLPAEPERREGFLRLHKVWHSQVRPEFAAMASPAFLFLFSALGILVDSRDKLKAADLWEPLGERAQSARDVHPAWKAYCECLPRAQAVLVQIDAYRSYSLFTGLDDLHKRVTQAEKRFREGAPAPGRRRA